MTNTPPAQAVPLDLSSKEYRDAKREAQKRGVSVEQIVTERYLKGARIDRARTAFGMAPKRNLH